MPICHYILFKSVGKLLAYCNILLTGLPFRRMMGNELAWVSRVIKYAASRVVITEVTIAILANTSIISRASMRKLPFRSISFSLSSSIGLTDCGSRIFARGLRESVVEARSQLVHSLEYSPQERFTGG